MTFKAFDNIGAKNITDKLFEERSVGFCCTNLYEKINDTSRCGSRALPSSLRPTEDNTGSHDVVMEVYADFLEYTIYRPADLTDFGENKFSIVIMMGPGRYQDGDSFRP